MKYLRRFPFSCGVLLTCFVALLLEFSTPTKSQVCNSPSGFLKSFGTMNIGDQLVLGPDCEHLTTFNTSRIVLFGPKTYFVSTTGNNNNDGNTSGTAWRDVNYAVAYVCSKIDINDQLVTIQLLSPNAAPFFENVVLCIYRGVIAPSSKMPVVRGDPTNTTTAQNIAIVSNAGITILGIGITTPWQFTGITIAAVGAGGINVEADYGTILYLKNMCMSTALANHVVATFNSMIEFLAPGFDCITVGAVTHLGVSQGARILYQQSGGSGVQIVHVNAVVYGGSWLAATENGSISQTGVTYAGPNPGGNQCGISLGGGVQTGGNLATIPGAPATCVPVAPGWAN